MPLDQIEGLAHAGQHAEREDVDLENMQRVEVVLVPCDDGAVPHRRVLDRHQLGQRAAGDHKAADMLREMPRKADQLRGEVEREAQGAVSGVEPGLAHPLIGDRVVAPAPHDAGERSDDIDAETQDLADLADRRARAVADYGGGETGAVAAVFFVDVLDHFFAPLVLEIDIDVGRLVARGADEALEQHIDAGRVDRGDAEAVADDGVGSGAASLTQDAAPPRKPHDIVDGQEIAGIVEPLDQLELVLDQITDLVRNAEYSLSLRLPGGEGRGEGG